MFPISHPLRSFLVGDNGMNGGGVMLTDTFTIVHSTICTTQVHAGKLHKPISRNLSDYRDSELQSDN